jgi:NADPH2:quinone reductase
VIYGTALHALEDRASPKPGETLVVLGAAGGTGLAAVRDSASCSA